MSRSKNVNIRVPQHIHEAWKAAAADADVSLSDWVRAAVDQAEPSITADKLSGRRTPTKAPALDLEPVAADPELLRQLAWIGNNVNQIARVANERHDLPALVTLAAVEKHLRALREGHLDAYQVD